MELENCRVVELENWGGKRLGGWRLGGLGIKKAFNTLFVHFVKTSVNLVVKIVES